ncbi:MAG: alpha/beta hydrolase [Methanoregula sp.]|uniref:alpha/beta fold hydrolase n=1 Tax=Methanoregula sp. TaxID=2052170 RepID=UPI003BAFBC5C
MKKLISTLLAAAVLLSILLVTGCTSSTTTSTPAAAPAVNTAPAINVTSIPVQYADVNGVRLGYREFGSGEPLLMICGFNATMDTMWNGTFLGILASQYHVYIYDNRGMGYSSDTNATPEISQYSDDAAALMPALGYSSMNVYGASMGSSIGQQLVIDHPERVRKLMLESVTYSIRIPDTRVLYAVIEATALDPTASAGVKKEAEANLAWNGTWDQLSGINKSVMLAVGTDDILTPPNVTHQIAGQINGSWLVEFKDLPHIGSGYAPVEYGETTLNFLGVNESPPY